MHRATTSTLVSILTLRCSRVGNAARVHSGWRPIAIAVASVIPFAASAQVSTNLERAPTLTIERYSEDWSIFANPANRKGDWTEPLKHIPLNDDGSVYLSTGLEARSRYEGYQNVNWGAAPDDDYAWHRLMPYADLNVGKVRRLFFGL